MGEGWVRVTSRRQRREMISVRGESGSTLAPESGMAGAGDDGFNLHVGT